MYKTLLFVLTETLPLGQTFNSKRKGKVNDVLFAQTTLNDSLSYSRGRFFLRSIFHRRGNASGLKARNNTFASLHYIALQHLLVAPCFYKGFKSETTAGAIMMNSKAPTAATPQSVWLLYARQARRSDG